MEREIEFRLLARLKAADPATFEAIYEAYRPHLFGFLARHSRRRDVAEDLLEETWVRLVARASELSDDRRLGPWPFTVARNLFASWVPPPGPRRRPDLRPGRLVAQARRGSLRGDGAGGDGTPPGGGPRPTALEGPRDTAPRER